MHTLESFSYSLGIFGGFFALELCMLHGKENINKQKNEMFIT